MSARSSGVEAATVPSTRDSLIPIGFGITGMVALVTTLLSAAMVWLVLARPLAVAHALEERQVAEAVQALCSLMVSMFVALVGLL